MPFHNLENNFRKWTIIITVCSIPNLIMGLVFKLDILGMLFGIFIFILFYGFLSSTSFINKIKNNKKTFYKSFQIAVRIKMATSILFIVDLFLGLISFLLLGFMFEVLGIFDDTTDVFLISFILTILQAFVIRLFIVLVAFITWLITKTWRLILYR